MQVNRVTKVLKGGKLMKFRATVVSGNFDGMVGFGIGKAREVSEAVERASSQARENAIEVPIHGEAWTFPHQIQIKERASRIMLRPAAEGTGVIAGGAVRNVLELAGYKNCFGKIYGTPNHMNNTRATINALNGMFTWQDLSDRRDVSIDYLQGRVEEPDQLASDDWYDEDDSDEDYYDEEYDEEEGAEAALEEGEEEEEEEDDVEAALDSDDEEYDSDEEEYDSDDVEVTEAELDGYDTDDLMAYLSEDDLEDSDEEDEEEAAVDPDEERYERVRFPTLPHSHKHPTRTDRRRVPACSPRAHVPPPPHAQSRLFIILHVLLRHPRTSSLSHTGRCVMGRE